MLHAMNILVPEKWLKSITKTEYDLSKIANLLTLRSSSVEYILDKEGDKVMDVEITVNRGDNLSILGIARELHAILSAEGENVTFNNPLNEIYTDELGTKDLLKINVTDTKLNPRFTALVLKDLKIGESPEYIKQRLKQVGIRPINNIVDITNYIMLETGQPMHSFDFDKIKNGIMTLRESKKGEYIITLDGQKRDLPENSIIIEDSEKIIDLCGIMGGLNSAIDENTKNIVLFTQIYEPLHIRKTSLALNHRTDAALRFEKGIDPSLAPRALLRGLKILKESTNFEVASKLYDLNSTTSENRKVALTYKKLELYANTKIEPKTTQNILAALGFKILENLEKQITVGVPSYRLSDVEIEEDLIEEVVRIYVYDKIGLILPPNYYDTDNFKPDNSIEKLVKYYLRDNGFNELITYSFVPKNQVDLDIAIKIDNPLGKDTEYMRTSHEPSLAAAISQNKDSVKVFELSNRYAKGSKELPTEELMLTALTNCTNHTNELKNKLTGIFKLLNIDDVEYKYPTNDTLVILINKSRVGELRIKDIYSYFELYFDLLVKNYREYPYVAPIVSFATIIEDLTIQTSLNSKAGEIIDSLGSLDKKIIKVEHKDDFVKSGKRALTLSFYYQDNTKNITDTEVQKLRNNLINFIENDLKYKVDRPS